MAWFLRVIERDDGSWACRHGTVEFDVHTELQGAVEHIRVLAASRQPAELFLHRLGGVVERIDGI
jgi:hypothetical protein